MLLHCRGNGNDVLVQFLIRYLKYNLRELSISNITAVKRGWPLSEAAEEREEEEQYSVTLQKNGNELERGAAGCRSCFVSITCLCLGVVALRYSLGGRYPGVVLTQKEREERQYQYPSPKWPTNGLEETTAQTQALPSGQSQSYPLQYQLPFLSTPALSTFYHCTPQMDTAPPP